MIEIDVLADTFTSLANEKIDPTDSNLIQEREPNSNPYKIGKPNY